MRGFVVVDVGVVFFCLFLLESSTLITKLILILKLGKKVCVNAFLQEEWGVNDSFSIM